MSQFTEFTVKIAHADDANIDLLLESLNLALSSSLRNIESIRVSDSGATIRRPPPPPKSYYITTWSAPSEAILMIPIELDASVADNAELVQQMLLLDLIPSGYDLTLYQNVDMPAYREAMALLDPRDSRFATLTARTQGYKYYKIVLVDGTNTIMKTRFVINNPDALRYYAVSLGKAQRFADVTQVNSISKLDYLEYKYNAIGRNEEKTHYQITATKEDGTNTTIIFKSQFIFDDNNALTAHAIRCNKLPAGALFVSVNILDRNASTETTPDRGEIALETSNAHPSGDDYVARNANYIQNNIDPIMDRARDIVNNVNRTEGNRINSDIENEVDADILNRMRESAELDSNTEPPSQIVNEIVRTANYIQNNTDESAISDAVDELSQAMTQEDSTSVIEERDEALSARINGPSSWEG